MTPYEIDLLLHFDTRGVAPEDCPILQETIDCFVLDGLIVRASIDTFTTYNTTPKGRAHVTQLCNLPYPKPAFVNAQNEVIEGTS